jgi:hypothetical protein
MCLPAGKQRKNAALLFSRAARKNETIREA